MAFPIRIHLFCQSYPSIFRTRHATRDFRYNAEYNIERILSQHESPLTSMGMRQDRATDNFWKAIDLKKSRSRMMLASDVQLRAVCCDYRNSEIPTSVQSTRSFTSQTLRSSYRAWNATRAP
jgi:predicted lipase